MRLCSSRERESVQLLRQWKLHHLLGPQYTDPCIYSSEWVAHMMVRAVDFSVPLSLNTHLFVAHQLPPLSLTH